MTAVMQGAVAPEGVYPAIPISLVFADGELPAASSDDFLRTWLGTQDFRGQRGRIVLVPQPAGGIARVVAGLGNARELDPLDVAQLSASLPPGDYTFDALPDVLDVGLVRFAWLLGTYRFDRYRSGRAPLNPPRLVFESTDSRVLHAAQSAEIAFAGTRLALDLINTPAADCGPREIEAIVQGMATAAGARTLVTHEPAELAALFPLVHAVGRASERAPRVIELLWGDEAAPRLTLVGKGVCFDTGGLALKPLDRMRHMKKDMAGAAHVLALAHMIISAQLPVRLRVLLPVVDNSIGSRSIHVGDVIAARNGITVEVTHPDAEGRLILADVLAAASEDEPDLIVDFATLTSVMRSVIGPDIAPFFTNDTLLAEALESASHRTADPLWRVPLHAAYRRWLSPGIADLANHRPDIAGGEPIYAALFLERFVGAGIPWVHFDIFAWSAEARPGRAAGAAVQGVRALFEALRLRYGADGCAARSEGPASATDQREELSGIRRLDDDGESARSQL